MMSPSISPRVPVVANLLKDFSPQELSQLVSMVPDLRQVEPDDAESVATHFRQLGVKQRSGRPATPNDPFMGGLTYAQYFALSKAEQDAFWERLFAASTVDIETTSFPSVRTPQEQ